MTLRLIYSDKYAPSNLRIRSGSTKKHYRIVLDQFGEFLGREAELADLDDDTILRFARWMTEVQSLSPATCNQRLGYLAALWRWCAKKKLAETWPSFRLLDEPKEVPRAWNGRQLGCLIPVLENQKGDIDGVPAGVWWMNLHQFLWETGERIGASLLIEWDMVDRHTRIFTVPAKIRKGKFRGMIYEISPGLMESLLKHKKPRHKMVFSWPFCEGTLYNRYERILKRAGLPHDRNSKFHRMRRSFASHFDKAGGDATRAFEHSSAKITRDSYLDPSISSRDASYKILPSLDSFREEQD